MTRTELINYIIKKRGYRSYLEIGLQKAERNFNKINAPIKKSVDPDPKAGASYCLTSDEYFSNSAAKWDVVFVDGLHHADQVRKDIINSWACLNDGGCLLLHDTNPNREEITRVPRETQEWTGDVYKAIYQIDGPPKFTLKDDHGVTVIRKTGPLVMSDGIIEWEGFDTFREVILHLVSGEEAIKIIDSWT